MPRPHFARLVVVSAVVTAVFAFAGCGSSAHQATMRSDSLKRWNLTRVGIMYQLAEQQYKVGDYDKCNETLKDAFATKAEFAPMYILAAKVKIEQGSLEAAAGDLNHAIHINANEPEPFYLLGVINQRWQKQDVACDYYEQAWNRKQDEARYLLAMIEMEISLNRLDQAEQTLDSKLVYFEQSSALHVALARIATLKNDFPTAADRYREACNLMPDDQNLRRSYAEALFYAGQFDKAAPILEDLRQRTDIAGKDNINMMLGDAYIGLRRFIDARNCYQEVIREKPDSMLAYLNLGKACIQTGDLSIAFAASRKVLRNEPDNVQAMILTALVQQKEKKFTDERDTLAKAAKLAPTDSTVLCMLGVNAQQHGEKEQAIGFYQKAVESNPKDAWATELLNRAKPPVAEAPAIAPTSVPAASDNISAEAAETPAAANTPVAVSPEPNP